MLLNSPTIGPAGDLVDVSYTGYPDCKGRKLRPPLNYNHDLLHYGIIFGVKSKIHSKKHMKTDNNSVCGKIIKQH